MIGFCSSSASELKGFFNRQTIPLAMASQCSSPSGRPVIMITGVWLPRESKAMPKSYRCGCAPASCARLTCCARRPIRLFLGVALGRRDQVSHICFKFSAILEIALRKHVDFIEVF